MKQDITLRIARIEDAERLLEIYAPYVTDTAISFEIEVPTVEEFRGRIERTLKTHPYLVAEHGGEIIGYAYASPFIRRAAYDWSAEMSIYLDCHKKGMGCGRLLYEAMETLLKQMHILNVNACIAAPKEPDPYVDNNSIEFHTHMGYTMVGKFHDSGYKFGTWYDMVWMEKMLGEHPQVPESVIPFSRLHAEYL